MDLGTMLDGLFPGGASEALNALEACCGRAPRAARAAAPKEWPPACPTGLCGTQGCVCRTRERACEDLTCLDIDIDFVAWANLNEFGTMIPTAPPSVSVSPPPVSVSPARTVAAPGKRGRGRPRKKPRKQAFAKLPSPPTPSLKRAPPPPMPSLVQDVAAALHDEARSQLSHKRLRSLEKVLCPCKPRRGAAKAFSVRSLASLFCEETLEDAPLCDLMCYETLPPH